jgi:hypothetical protein
MFPVPRVWLGKDGGVNLDMRIEDGKERMAGELVPRLRAKTPGQALKSVFRHDN